MQIIEGFCKFASELGLIGVKAVLSSKEAFLSDVLHAQSNGFARNAW